MTNSPGETVADFIIWKARVASAAVYMIWLVGTVVISLPVLAEFTRDRNASILLSLVVPVALFVLLHYALKRIWRVRRIHITDDALVVTDRVGSTEEIPVIAIVSLQRLLERGMHDKLVVVYAVGSGKKKSLHVNKFYFHNFDAMASSLENLVGSRTANEAEAV